MLEGGRQSVLSFATHVPIEEKLTDMTAQHRTNHSRRLDFERLEALHQHCLTGNAAAEEEIAKIIHEYGVAYASKKFAFNHDVAEDFGQELFIAYRTGHAEIRSIHAWLLAVPIRIGHNFLRKKYRWSRVNELPPDWCLPPNSPEQQIIDRMEAHAGMRLFTRREGLIVYLRIWRDWPFADIAKKLDLNVDNTKRIYQRALKKLARLLAPPGLQTGVS
jgi:DNA-directed RNA polymerase specialized sigma24 family protein